MGDALVSGMVLIAVGSVVTIGCLKGRYALSLIGLLFALGTPALLAAARLARADSWWARRFYDQAKLDKVATRYPTTGARSTWTL